MTTVSNAVHSPRTERRCSPVADRDGSVRLFDKNILTENYTWMGHSAKVACCAFSTDGTIAITGGADDPDEPTDNTLKLWDVGTVKTMHAMRRHSSAVLSCAISPDGTTVLSASDDNTLKLW